MTRSACPSCGEPIPPPSGHHGLPGEMHSHRECPRCRRILIWFTEGPLADEWRIDEREERRAELERDA